MGALVAARQLVRALGLRLVPYALLLVVPLIGRMSDASPLARSLASAAFASVVAIMPLMDRVRPPGQGSGQRGSGGGPGCWETARPAPGLLGRAMPRSLRLAAPL